MKTLIGRERFVAIVVVLGSVLMMGCFAATLGFLDHPQNMWDLEPLSQVFTRGQCQGSGDVRLTAAPADPADLSHIFPLGLMTGAHVTPVDHQYYYWLDMNASLRDYTIHSPADGVIVEVSYMADDYRVIIEHSCDVFTIWIHLEELAGSLAHLNGALSGNRNAFDRVPVSAGEIIAYDGGTPGFDFSVHDNRVILPGFVDPTSYIAEPWKVHTVDPYEYFVEPIRSLLLTKNVRQVEPLGGKLDYDIPGALMGNWFVENTNGYAGNSAVIGTVAPDQQVGYWSTHLAIAPTPLIQALSSFLLALTADVQLNMPLEIWPRIRQP